MPICGFRRRQPAGDVSQKPATDCHYYWRWPTLTFPASEHDRPWPAPIVLLGEQRHKCKPVTLQSPPPCQISPPSVQRVAARIREKMLARVLIAVHVIIYSHTRTKDEKVPLIMSQCMLGSGTKYMSTELLQNDAV